MEHEHVEVNAENGNCTGPCHRGHPGCIVHPHTHRRKHPTAPTYPMPVAEDNHGDGGWDVHVFGEAEPVRHIPPSPAQWAVDGMVVPTEQAYDILSRLLPEWRDLFVLKNSKYRTVDNALGPRGVFPDVYRKVGVLRDRVWDQRKEAQRIDEDDDTRRVVLDLIGHLFLMLHMMDKESGRA